MTDFRKPSGDTIEELKLYIKKLEDRISDLQNMKTPTIPTYDLNNLPEDAIEGQIAIITST